MINYNVSDLVDHNSVAAVIKDDKGRILMQEHVKYGFWTILIGKAKQGQSPEEGIKEEVLEECNLKIKKCKEIVSKKYNYIRNDVPVNVFLHVFEVLDYTGEMKNKEPDKHSRQEFQELDKIKKLPYLSDATILYLETIGFNREVKIN